MIIDNQAWGVYQNSCPRTLSYQDDFTPPSLAHSRPYIDTSLLDADDRNSCQECYDRIRHDIEAGHAWLKRARENDPFREGEPRLAFETVTGAKAPPPPLGPSPPGSSD